MEAGVLLIQYTLLFNPHLKWFLRVLWHSREHNFCHGPWILVTLWQWMSSVWTLILQTSRPGSGNPKRRPGNADFAHSESLGHTAKNWEKRGKCGQVSALGVNGSHRIWDRWKTILAKKNNNQIQAGSEEGDFKIPLFHLQLLNHHRQK